MADFVVAVIILAMLGTATAYIRKAKKSGVRCIGCPAAGACAQKQKEASGCGCKSGCDGGCHTDT